VLFRPVFACKTDLASELVVSRRMLISNEEGRYRTAEFECQKKATSSPNVYSLKVTVIEHDWNIAVRGCQGLESDGSSLPGIV